MSVFTGELREYMKKLDLTKQRMEGRITETYRKLITEIFVDLVTHTPQFTGNLAYQWQIVFGPYSIKSMELASEAERSGLFKAYTRGDFEPFEQGDDPTVAMVLDRELPKLAQIRYNSKVRIVNTADYAEDVDANQGPNGFPIRDENLHYGKVFMTTRAAIKYGRMSTLLRIAQ